MMSEAAVAPIQRCINSRNLKLSVHKHAYAYMDAEQHDDNGMKV